MKINLLRIRCIGQSDFSAYWNNTLGWVKNEKLASLYTLYEAEESSLPHKGSWEPVIMKRKNNE